jgi:hypothetical protein
VADHITLTRRQAAVKLQAAKSGRYFFQRAGGIRYERDVSVEEVSRAFQGDEKMRMRVRLSDSQHTAYAIKNAREERGYEVFFS